VIWTWLGAAAVGLSLGLLGSGGGFLIVPLLVLFRKHSMPTAIGTSLAIISVNSATGFLTSLSVLGEQVGASGVTLKVDWNIIGVFIALGVAGSLVGNLLASRINQGTLKRIFAVFLVVMAGYILVRQAPRVMPVIFGLAATTAPAHWEPDAPAAPLK